MTSQNDAELRQQLADLQLCLEQVRIEADQLKLDNSRLVDKR